MNYAIYVLEIAKVAFIGMAAFMVIIGVLYSLMCAAKVIVKHKE